MSDKDLVDVSLTTKAIGETFRQIFSRFRFFAILQIITLSASYAATDRGIALTNDESSAVNRGEIILRELPSNGAVGKTFEAIGLFNVPVERMFSVLTDFRSHPKFMPNTERVDIRQTTNETTIVDMTLALPLGKKKRYRLELRTQKNHEFAQISWRKIAWPELSAEETIVDAVGFWRLKPAEHDSKKTVALYHVYTDPGEIPFGFGWIVDYLTKKSIPNIFYNTRTYLTQSSQ